MAQRADLVRTKLYGLFTDEDDSPLPEFRLTSIPMGSAAAIWKRLLSGARFADPHATVHVVAYQCDVLATAESNLAARAERGEVDMHVVIAGASAESVVVPDLGVSIWPGEIAIDYRVNVWTPVTASAFVALLAELRALAPGSQVLAADESGRAYDDATQDVLNHAICSI